MLSKIWISRTSKGELNILAGERASKVASIELESLSSYIDIILSAMIYIFEIPPATAVFMTFNDAFSDPIVITYPFKTIVTSPLYGSNSDIITSVPYLVYDIHKSSARFSLLQYDIPSEMEYYIIADGMRIK
uniref:Uncharacterized protein n=2 Tax=Panagrolaimus davidi TaxID=227884 RepID=A0A914PYF0_9BILA